MYVIIDTKTVRNGMNKNIMCVSKLAEASGLKESTLAHMLVRGTYARVQDKTLYAIAGALEESPEHFTADLEKITEEKNRLRDESEKAQGKKKEALEKKLAYLDKLVK